MFKAFKSPRALGEHISDLDNSDYYEDISLAFDYFANYGIIHPADIFSEQSNFSLSRMLNSLINSQMQPSYILTYIVLAVVNVMFLKFDFLVSTE